MGRVPRKASITATTTAHRHPLPTTDVAGTHQGRDGLVGEPGPEEERRRSRRLPRPQPRRRHGPTDRPIRAQALRPASTARARARARARAIAATAATVVVAGVVEPPCVEGGGAAEGVDVLAAVHEEFDLAQGGQSYASTGGGEGKE